MLWEGKDKWKRNMGAVLYLWSKSKSDFGECLRSGIYTQNNH